MSIITEDTITAIFQNTFLANRTSGDFDLMYKRVRTRTLWIGSIGTLLNLLAIVFLCFTRKVKTALRVTMIGLSLNDFFFMIDFTLLGIPQRILTTDFPDCWPVTYIVVSSIIVSYLITSLLALHNFVAVFYPFHCTEILSVPRSILAVVGCWISGYVIGFACVGTMLESNLPCYAIVVVPRNGLAVGCGVCLISSVFIITINLKICQKIRSRRSTVPMPSVSVGRNPQYDMVQANPSSSGQSADNETRNCSKMNTFRQSSSQCKTIEIFSVTQSLNSSNVKGERCLTLSANKPYTSSQRDCFVLKCNSSIHNLNITTPNTVSPPDTIGKTLCVGQNLPSNKSVLPSQHNTHQIHRCGKTGTSNTLTILTWWSCFLTFPLLIEMTYGTIWVHDRITFSTSSLGILVSSLLVIHGVSNPLLYAWRFTGWRAVYSRVARMCA